MERLSLKAEARTEIGKNSVGRLRRQGFIPAVLYGKTRDPLAIKVNALELAQKLTSNAIIDLTIAHAEQEEKAVVILKDLQRSVIKKDLIHADFHEISLKDRMIVSVTIELTGTPAGLTEGGVISQLLREVEVECLPTDIPNLLTLDISELNIGDSLEVGQIELPEGVDFITPADETVVALIRPSRSIEDEEEAEEDEELFDAEPEVIGEKDEEEEE